MFRLRPIGNRQLQIGNRMTHPLPRGGTDLIAVAEFVWSSFDRYGSSGGETLGFGKVGFGDGALVAAGEGTGGASSIDVVGEGNGGLAGRRFELSLVFGLGSSTTTSGELPAGNGVEAFTFAFSGVVLPPSGRFASGEPVAGVAGSTGLLFGSAASVVPPGVTGAG